MKEKKHRLIEDNMLEKYNKSCQQVISLAESLAFSYLCKEVTPVHLFLAFLKTNDTELAKLIKKDISINSLEKEYLKNDNPRNGSDDFFEQINFYMEYNKDLRDLMSECENNAEPNTQINTYNLAFYLIKNINIKYINDIGYMTKSELIENMEKQYLPCQELERLSDLHRLGTTELDPLIGRMDTINQLVMILTRRNKPNPLLIGEPGVGKSFIVNHLAKLINDNKIPQLKNYAIFELDLPATVGGTKYRGEFEEKIKKIVVQVSKSKQAILFIDEIHTIINAGGADGAIDFSNIIKPYLSRGDIKIIGATTIDEYEKYFSKDSALKRRFQAINILENTEEETIEILQRLKETYEKYYNKKIDSDVIDYICQMASRHILNQSFPDKAIDLLDNSLALTKNEILTKNDIDYTLSYIYRINTNKTFNISSFETKLNEKIKGQTLAIREFLFAIKNSLNRKRNEGVKEVMLLTGPSGVGKSYLVKTFCKMFYNSLSNLFELNSSTIKEPHNFNKMFCNEELLKPYKEDSPMIKHIKKYPNSIIIINSAEKLNEENVDKLVEIFENGKITSNNGEKIDFSNATFVLIGNFTSSQLDRLHNNLFANDSEEDNVKYKMLEGKFSYNFICQIDDIISFEELNNNAIHDIEELYSIDIKNKSKTYINEIKRFGARAIIKKAHKNETMKQFSLTNEQSVA